MSERLRLIVSAAVAAVVAIVIWVALPRERVVKPVATREPRTFPAESILTVSLDRIKKYADRLQFDEGLGADSELVDFERGQIGTGTPAKIEPEVDSYLLDRQDLASGRIIARIRTATEVRQLGFGPWYTWWWVDKHGPGGTWRSIYIAETEKSPADRRPRPDSLEQGYHSEGHYQQALARWYVVNRETPSGDPPEIASWGSCSPCCRQRLPVLSPP
jgi:hypothetical protein